MSSSKTADAKNDERRIALAAERTTAALTAMPPERRLGLSRHSSVRASMARRSTQTVAAAGAAAQASSAVFSSRKTRKSRSEKQTPQALTEYSDSVGDAIADDSERGMATDDAPSMVCALSYRGMEMIFASHDNTNQNRFTCSNSEERCTRLSVVTAICSRTRVPLQRLTLPLGSGAIVAMASHPTTGMVLVATEEGSVHTYYPVPTLVAPRSSRGPRMEEEEQQQEDVMFMGMANIEHQPVTAFGRYFWITGRTVRCQDVFQNEKVEGFMFVRRRGTDAAPTSLQAEEGTKENVKADSETHMEKSRFMDLSTSIDYKVLVSHRDQMAVFDASPLPPASDLDAPGSPLTAPPATLLWTTRTHATILHAKISGDGHAIAFVLEAEGVGVPYPYGVRTFVHDLEDGRDKSASLVPSSEVAPAGAARRQKNPGAISPPPIHEDVMYDDSNACTRTHNSKTTSLPVSSAGILYKAGPFLVHSNPVTRITFRGLGKTYSTILPQGSDDHAGNDLLLTACAIDGSMRIFNQNSWHQLMHWSTPAGSRADWIQGITVANLGDLDVPSKKKGRGANGATTPLTTSAPASRRPSISDLSEGGASAGINKHLLAPAQPTLPSHPTPSSAAGAWISELTFRGPFPALRLSRLSYLKSGGDIAAPAHFESVAAILPPGTIPPSSVLQSVCGNEETGMIVQGIWSAWNPWESNPNAASGDESLSGSAMALLGASPSTLSGTNGAIHPLAASALGGTHTPPSELRLISSHYLPGKIVIMEFPLWGDKDFGAMELGSPLRYLLSLKEDETCSDVPCPSAQAKTLTSPLPITISTTSVSLDFESSRLSASVSPYRHTVYLSWRKQGTMSIYRCPVEENRPHPGRSSSMVSIASTVSLDSNDSRNSFLKEDHDEGIAHYIDLSVTPLPLSLPPLHLPPNTSTSNDNKRSRDKISVLKWWPDENFGGPPRLLVLTTSGTLIVYEMPPPWSALEPAMPSYDPFAITGSASASENGMSEGDEIFEPDTDDDSVTGESGRKEYEVNVIPHPDFGLGLRLEAQAEGMPAVAGSYKKHPLSGGRLPAEKTGMIVLGDELLAVNNVSLEGMSFDEIIGTVRTIGSELKGGALCMKFRPTKGKRRRSLFGEIMSSNEKTISSTSGSSTGERNYLEQISDVKSKSREGPNGDDFDDDQASNAATVMVGADSEFQQEFCRIVALVRNALPSYSISPDAAENKSPRSLVLLPWHYGKGAPIRHQTRDACIFVSAVGRTLTASRLEISSTSDPGCARFFSLGSVQIELGKDYSEEKCSECDIRSLNLVKIASEGWCLAACDGLGKCTLIFVDTIDGDDESGANPKGKVSTFSSDASNVRAVFRYVPIFCCKDKSLGDTRQFLLRPSSIDLLATMPVGPEECDFVSVWSSLPLLLKLAKDKEDVNEIQTLQDYSQTVVFHRGVDIGSEPILDFRWVASGCVDAFPWLVTFSCQTAVVHRRPGGCLHWIPVAELTYPSIRGSSDVLNRPQTAHDGPSMPCDVYPHIVSTLRNVVSATDEHRFLRSDWHPDSILAYLCTENDGVEKAFKRNVKGIFKWLSRWMKADDSFRPTWNTSIALASAPLSVVNDKSPERDKEEHTEDDSIASNLLATISRSKKLPTDEETLLAKLQSVLRPGRVLTKKKGFDDQTSKSKEFILAMAAASPKDNEETKHCSLPAPIEKLSRDELRFLWAIGEILNDPPNFKILDPQAQLACFCISLMQHVENATNDDELEQEKEPANSLFAPTQNGPSFFAKKSSNSLQNNNKQRKAASMAGGACVAAFLSDSQSRLLETCRKPDQRMDWPTARALLLPFWLRSDTDLKKISEEIAQNIYKKTRDAMECALFYVATGNKRSLRSIAATDRSDSGRKFYSFLNSYDFTSARGRSAAEKNAFSLLRKRRYAVAVAFFLLAEPPMLKSALEVILTQMEDLSLAFFVARLMQRTSDSSAGSVNNGLTIGSAFSLSSLGGGGGYASSSSDCCGISGSSLETHDLPYKDWKANLGFFAKSLLRTRGLHIANNEPCLQALLFLWLDRPNDAVKCLLGRVYSETDHTDRFCDVSTPSPFEIETLRSTTSQGDSANNRVILKSNALIDFISRPFLLKTLKAPKRAQWASSLLVSRALSRRGIELPSIRLLMQNTDPTNLEEEQKQLDAKVEKNEKLAQAPGTSFIFDTFSSTMKLKQKSVLSTSVIAPPSILGSFDASRSAAKPAPSTSSIFDSFDVPFQKPKAKPAVTNSDNMTSSIFDSFEAPPRPKTKPVPKPTSTSGEMSSSIFDSFDASCRTKLPPQSASALAPTTTDSFEHVHFEGDITASEKPTKDTELKPQNDLSEEPAEVSLPVSTVWIEWRQNLLTSTVARRLLREMARIVDYFEGNATPVPIELFRRHIHPLVPHGASHVLHNPCEGDALLTSIQQCLENLCGMSELRQDPVLEQALLLLACPSQPRKIVFTVLLHCLSDRADLAEDIIRNASHDQLQRCDLFVTANDDLVHSRKTMHHVSSQYARRQAAVVSWQLELCLWLHRGGIFHISGVAIKEATIAVRVGLLVASWGRNHESIETMLKCEPDCSMDFELGRQLWSSMKLISGFGENVNKSGATTSGGWEFLVDCRRDEATESLRERKPGAFLLRPRTDDHGVFTLSFRTNLVPLLANGDVNPSSGNASGETIESKQAARKSPTDETSKSVKRDEVVQHAIIRLSDAGFRCGSFGPFTTLIRLLEAVSSSLPFGLLFNEPPDQRIIGDQGSQPSPNSFYIRKSALHSKTDHFRWNKSTRGDTTCNVESAGDMSGYAGQELKPVPDNRSNYESGEGSEFLLRKRYGAFSQLLVLTEMRKQLSAVAAAEYEDLLVANSAWEVDQSVSVKFGDWNDDLDEDDFDGSLSDSVDELGEEEVYAVASRMLRPLLSWCRALEASIAPEIAPTLLHVSRRPTSMPVAVAASDSAVEAAPAEIGSCIDGGDAVIRKMIQPKSGVEFRTLRVGEGSHSAVVVLFCRSEAIGWLIASGAEKDKTEAAARLERMEKRRVIERINLNDLVIGKGFALPTGMLDAQAAAAAKKEIRYRFVDPWEVEALESKDGELKAASLGRERYLPFSVGTVARVCEKYLRSLGGLHLMSLWAATKGGISLTKAIASVHSPWERDAGGDLQMRNEVLSEPSPYENNIRQLLYRNALFRRLQVPQRFLALVQVELLDLKNLTAPSGTASISAYALLRLKREGSNAPLNQKARTLDSACTEPKKIGKSTGPNAPASWGSLVRFRFPLPEDVNCDGVSFDSDREALFQGPPAVLQMSVYEKKFMSDSALGGADVKLDALVNGGQLEEWIPLRAVKDGIHWFARIRLTLRFELMCLENESQLSDESTSLQCPSVGLRKIRLLSRLGGAHEDTKGLNKSVSTPDFVAYIESMVY